MFDNKKIQKRKPGFNAQAFSHARSMVSSNKGEFQIPYELVKDHHSISGMSKREYSRRPEIQENIKREALKGNIDNYPYDKNYIRELNQKAGGGFDLGQLTALVHSIGPQNANKLIKDPESIDPEVRTRALEFIEHYEGYSKPDTSSTSPYSEQDYSQDLLVDDEIEGEEQAQNQQMGMPQEQAPQQPIPEQINPEQPNQNSFEQGGELQSGQSVDSLVTKFEGGGTHEQNPLGGIPQGQGVNGKQNLVEEGETKWQDYVFSNAISIS